MPKRMTAAAFDALVSSYGATLDADSLDNGTYNVDLPAGRVWAANGCHCLSVPFSNGSQTWAAQARAEAAADMRLGTQPCDAPPGTCDICEGY